MAGGHSHMTSALRERGVGPKADKSTDRLRDCDSNKGRGIENPEHFADVIFEWSPARITHSPPFRPSGGEKNEDAAR